MLNAESAVVFTCHERLSHPGPTWIKKTKQKTNKIYTHIYTYIHTYKNMVTLNVSCQSQWV